MHPLLAAVFSAFEEKCIRYALIGPYRQLRAEKPVREIDLLARAAHLSRLCEVLCRLGFIPVPSWGHAPHHFFVSYAREEDLWIKLDVVTDLCFGKPIRALRLGFAGACLERRRRFGETYLLAPEDGFIVLLTKCLIHNTGFHSFLLRGRELVALYRRVLDEPGGERRLERAVNGMLAPALSASLIFKSVERRNWQSLMARRAALIRRMFWCEPLATLWRLLRGLTLRKGRRLLFALFRQGVWVVLLAPDGGGKSTLARHLSKDAFIRGIPIYMGGNPRSRTVGLPSPGWIEDFPGSSSRAGSYSLKRAFLKVIRAIHRWLDQQYRLTVAVYQRLRGRFVVFDRYVYDSWVAREKPSGLKRLKRRLLGFGFPRPDLVLLLDAPGQVLYRRKGEHTPGWLEAQRQAYLGLKDRITRMAVVDSTVGADAVRRQAISLIWNVYGNRQESRQRPSCDS